MRLLAQTFMVLALLLVGGSASAIPAYTLDASVPFSGGNLPNLIGSVDPVATNSVVHADAICLDAVGGVCNIDIFTQDWLLFQISVTAGSLDELGVSLPTLAGLTLGYFSGTGVAPDANCGVACGSNIDVATDPVFKWETSGLTTTSAVLFVAYPDSSLPHLPFLDPPGIPLGPLGQTKFMVSETGDPGNEPVEGISTTSISVIPEPSTAALLALGLAGLTFAGRRPR